MEFDTFDTETFADELRDAERNHEIATRVLFENQQVRVWELALAPGERAPFHCHAVRYFFVCVDAGRALSRFPNGTSVEMDYAEGDTWFDELQDGPEIHDLENIGKTRLRFTTVELLDS